MRYKSLIIAGLVVIGGAALAVMALNRPSLVRVTPAGGSTNIPITQEIVFEFDRPMAAGYAPQGEDKTPPQNLIEVEPYVDGETRVEGNKIIFKPITPFWSGRQYVAELVNVRGQNGFSGRPEHITFTTVDLPAGQRPASDPGSARNLLARSLPYQDPRFSIEYMEREDYFLIRITDSPVEQNKQLALDFLRSNGVNVENEQISYFVIRGLD